MNQNIGKMGQEKIFLVEGDTSSISQRSLREPEQFNIFSKGVNNKVTRFAIDAKLLKVNQDQEKNCRSSF